MTATFTYVPNWNAAYIATPADTDEEAQGAAQIRNLKGGVEERLTIDHSWNGDGNDGKHQWATLRQSGQTTTYALDAGDGRVWGAQVNGNTELFYQDSGGNVIQLTSAGAINITFPAQQWTAGSVTGLGGSLSLSGTTLQDSQQWQAGTVTNVSGGTVSGNTLTINFPSYTWPNGHTFLMGLNASSNSSGVASITFSPSFAGTPQMFLSITGSSGSSTAQTAEVGAISGSGATVYTYGLSSGSVALAGPLTFNWLAIY